MEGLGLAIQPSQPQPTTRVGKATTFAIATFYYATNREAWKNVIRERLMDNNKDECFWYSAGFGLLQRRQVSGVAFLSSSRTLQQRGHIDQTGAIQFRIDRRIPPDSPRNCSTLLTSLLALTVLEWNRLNCTED